MGKPLPEVVYSSVLLIFVRCRTQTQLNHTFIVVGWMGERGGGEGRGGEGREEGIKKGAAMWVAVNSFPYSFFHPPVIVPDMCVNMCVYCCMLIQCCTMLYCVAVHAMS